MMPALDEQGLACSLVTLTLAHSYADDWAVPVNALKAAWGLADRRLSKAYKKAGCIGKFKALEMPIGQHGAHPHFHLLVTHDKSADLGALKEAMRDAWFKAVPEVGGRCNEHGFDFKANAAATYVAKMETAHEMAALSTKQGRKKGRTLSQLLDAAGRGDLQAGAEWQRAIKAVGISNRFHAGSLPKNLGIPCPSEWEDEQEADDDAELAEAVEPVEPVVIEYPLDDHLQATHPALGRPGLAMILRAAHRGGKAKALRMVSALCADYRKKNAYRSLDVGEPWCVEPIPYILETARMRPLMPEEIPAYLAAKKLAVLAGSRASAEAAAEHRPSAALSHLVEHRTGEHSAKRTLDADKNADKLVAVGAGLGFQSGTDCLTASGDVAFDFGVT